MKAIIVAGGKGERLKPLTNTVPKPMVEVDGKPILEHIITSFKNQGITEFIVTLCYLPDKITNYFGAGEKFGVSIEYLFEDPKNPLGTAGSISAAQAIVAETCIVTYADILRKVDLEEMLRFHQEQGALATISVYKKSNNPKSLVKFDKNKKITSFIERPKNLLLSSTSMWVNASLYIFEPEIFSFIPKNKKNDFGKDILPTLIREGKSVYAYTTDGYVLDIGDEEKLKKARKKLHEI